MSHNAHNALSIYLCLTFSTLFLLLSVLNVEVKAEKCSCGKIYPMKEQMIISGNRVNEMDKYPFIVSIHIKNNASPWGFCAGALISDNFVITAAHCLQDIYVQCDHQKPECFILPTDMEIGLLGKDPKKPAEKVEVEAIIPHPSYDMVNTNDIALIKLKYPVECSLYTQPVCISKYDFVDLGEKVTIAGWGRTKFENPAGSNVLLEGIVRSVNNKYCGSDPKRFCTVGTTETTCVGDSGSAAFTKRNRRYFAVGVTSGQNASYPICGLSSPITFSKISSYYRFISRYVKNLETF